MSVPSLEPLTAMREDEALPGLPSLFEAEPVWGRYCASFGVPEHDPQTIRIENVTYRPGRRILISYRIEYPEEQWIADEQFSVYLRAGKKERVFRYPDDPFLPGLPSLATPIEAHSAITKHLQLRPRRVLVEPMRYRPGSRAVIRQVLSWGGPQKTRTTLYARAVPPRRLPRLLGAFDLISASRFTLPKLVGVWEEGGVVWMGEVSGKTLRQHVRNGDPPDAGAVLDAIAPLWDAPFSSEEGKPLNLSGGFDLTQRQLTNVLQEGTSSHESLMRIADGLRSFVEGWRPTARAHNDFHDDQVIVTDEGGLALVDFEEAGPGDPQMDVANMLGHLAWMGHFGTGEGYVEYERALRAAAIARFDWDPKDLAIRQAFTVFRLSSNPVRNMRPDWQERVARGLSLTEEILARTA